MPKLAVASVDGKGRCVFAREAITKGSIVTADPVALIPKSHVDALAKAGSPFAAYPFAWTPHTHAVPLGLTSLANHSDEPNCHVSRNIDRKVLGLIAKRDIDPGEEITYDYKVPLWFDPQPPSRLSLPTSQGGQESL